MLQFSFRTVRNGIILIDERLFSFHAKNSIWKNKVFTVIKDTFVKGLDEASIKNLRY